MRLPLFRTETCYDVGGAVEAENYLPAKGEVTSEPKDKLSRQRAAERRGRYGRLARVSAGARVSQPQKTFILEAVVDLWIAIQRHSKLFAILCVRIRSYLIVFVDLPVRRLSTRYSALLSQNICDDPSFPHMCKLPRWV